MAFIRSGGFRKLVLAVALVAFGVGAGLAYLANSVLSDLPDLRSVADYRPPQTSRVLDREGRLIGEFHTERRTIAPMATIPLHVKLAFVAAEDANFFQHSGIDYTSILRAAWVDITEGKIKQGASTITMQLVKQLLLSSERTFRRKFREMYLARKIEQSFSKDEILWLYLNQIYFGQGAWGVAEAASTYFGKTVAELTVSDAALLAGLPQRPSEYSPFRSPRSAERRRRYVLGRMLAEEILDRPAYEMALAEPPAIVRSTRRQDYASAAYFSEEVRRYLYDALGSDRVLNGGLTIRTTLDLDLQNAAVAAVRKGIENHDKRQGYRGHVRQVAPSGLSNEIEALTATNKIEFNELGIAEAFEVDRLLLGVVTSVDTKTKVANVSFGSGALGRVELADVKWAGKPDPTRRLPSVKKIERIFSPGDVARFRVIESEEDAVLAAEQRAAELEQAGDDANGPRRLPISQRLTLHQEPQIQGALFSLDVATGDVLALVGGYDFFKSEFNRVTQAKRQPGSAFKPFIYGAAMAHDYSPVATIWDRPAVYEDPISGFVWRPQNYGRKFYGPMPMRTALVRSINNATVHLFRDLGVDYVIDFSKRLGIQSPLSRDLSLALGSSDVSLLELTSAYAVFPNHGRRVIPRFILSVSDDDGDVYTASVPLGNPPPPVEPYAPFPEDGEEAENIDVAAQADYEQSEEHTDDTQLSLVGEAIASALGDGSFDGLEDIESDAPVLSTQIISENVAYLMCDMLKAVVSDPRGTGWRLKALKRPLAGKTGTTNDQADAWFLGFSPDIATGVWVGHDESLVLGKGETGSRAAAPVWVDFMRVALADRPIRDFEVPEQIEFHRIDRATGLLADADTKDAYFQPFVENTQPTRQSAKVSTASDTRRALRDDTF